MHHNFFEKYKSGRKKHFRRCAKEIDKNQICPYTKCQKWYGSEGSLNLHMKNKHNAGSKTEREKIAKIIVSCTLGKDKNSKFDDDSIILRKNLTLGLNNQPQFLLKLGGINLPPGTI